MSLVCTGSVIAQELPPPRELPPELIQQFSDRVDDEVIILSPEEYRQIRDIVEENERAKADRYDYAEPRISNEVISNDPGAPIPEISAGVNHNTYLTFKDEAGNPWPVTHSNMGNQSAYKLNEIESHIFEIVVVNPNSFSNITFMLDGHDGPVMINVRPPEHYIDYVKNYTVRGIGPGTAAESRALAARTARTREQPQVDTDMSVFLDGLPPEDAVPVAVIDGAEQDMWVWNDRLIIRTKSRLMAPSAESEPLYGSNGWRVYSVRNPNSILTFVQNGRTEMTFISEAAISELRR